MTEKLLPAAQYLRMSTEHQQYSLDNQRSAIESYAEAHGFQVVQTYTDGARSGVALKRRKGLKQLLQDVMSQPAYQAVLVYDISRWGRFQNADEAAHYEFLCKSSGVPVHYCAEVFVNDGTLPNMLLKALKRTMAGEYSRGLGVEVLAGQKRLARLGFKQGGKPGYGLRRMLVTSEREPKQLLIRGERKSIATDRVILVPGPEEEVQCVREIYRMLLHEKLSVCAIARELNSRGVEYRKDSRWDHLAVNEILTQPKYAGCHVFARTSCKLSTPSVRLPKSEWVVTPNAHEPIIEQATFDEAQRILQQRTIHRSDQQVLGSLTQLLEQEGKLSLSLIKTSPLTPSPSTYRHRFGSLSKAYEQIGYVPSSDFKTSLRRQTQVLREHVMAQIQQTFPKQISVVRRGGRWRSHLRLKGGMLMSELVGRSVDTPIRHELRWQVDPVRHESNRVTLVLLLEKGNSAVHAMYIFPRMDIKTRLHLHSQHDWLKGGERLNDFAQFLELVATAKRR